MPLGTICIGVFIISKNAVCLFHRYFNNNFSGFAVAAAGHMSVHGSKHCKITGLEGEEYALSLMKRIVAVCIVLFGNLKSVNIGVSHYLGSVVYILNVDVFLVGLKYALAYGLLRVYLAYIIKCAVGKLVSSERSVKSDSLKYLDVLVKSFASETAGTECFNITENHFHISFRKINLAITIIPPFPPFCQGTAKII